MAIILAMCPKQTGGLLKLHRTIGKPRDPNPKPMFALIASHGRAHARIASDIRERLRSVDGGFSLRILYYPGGNILFASALFLSMKVF
jgi:hypothetical protein